MNTLEYFLHQINGWISLSLEEYLSISFSGDKNKFSKIKFTNNLPIQFVSSPKSDSNTEILLVSGNFIEVLTNQYFTLEKGNKIGQIKISNSSNKQPNKYNVWVRAKIVTHDTESKLLFIEMNDEIHIIDNMEMIWPLQEVKLSHKDLIGYQIRKVLSNDYNSIKEKLENIHESDNLFYCKYDIIKSSLLCICNKNDLNNISLLKEYEDNCKDKNINSDFSYTNSNQSLVGVKTFSEISDNSDNKVINTLDEETRNEINKYKFKKHYIFREKFKKDLVKCIGEYVKKCKFCIGKNFEKNFDFVLCGNDETEFMEEKNILDNNFKQLKLNIDNSVDKSKINDIAKISKIKFVSIENKHLYLVGEEKNINIFKSSFEIAQKYSKEKLKTSRENESLQKELQTFKKKTKIK